MASSRSRSSQAGFPMSSRVRMHFCSFVIVSLTTCRLVNLLPNGSNDGGLIVCKGAHKLSEQFHEEMAWEDKIPAWTPEWYGFTDRGMQWLEDHGCEWIKVCAEPGDLLLWDSRTPHYNLSSITSQPRFCIYTCYMPVADASKEDLIRKKKAFEGESHPTDAVTIFANRVNRSGWHYPLAKCETQWIKRCNERW